MDKIRAEFSPSYLLNAGKWKGVCAFGSQLRFSHQSRRFLIFKVFLQRLASNKLVLRNKQIWSSPKGNCQSDYSDRSCLAFALVQNYSKILIQVCLDLLNIRSAAPAYPARDELSASMVTITDVSQKLINYHGNPGLRAGYWPL